MHKLLPLLLLAIVAWRLDWHITRFEAGILATQNNQRLVIQQTNRATDIALKVKRRLEPLPAPIGLASEDLVSRLEEMK